MSIVFCLMIRRPPRSTRTDTLFPYTTLFRSDAAVTAGVKHIVYVSSLGTRAAEEPEVWASYYATEQAMMRKAPAWSILRMRSEEHTSELQSLMRISYAVFCLKKIVFSILTATWRINSLY